MITILITHNTAGPSGKDPGGSKAGGSSSRNDSPRTLLLREGLRIMGRTACAERFSPDMLKCTEDGKPFIPDLPDIHVSRSHSGEYIACAFSDREVGLDLQEHSRVQTSTVRIAKRFFSSAEYEAILALEAGINAAKPGGPAGRSPLFLRMWSIKEASLKYLG
ncbi:MAG: 4'-phosphopantetheinyl transferase superfamily protein [Clostridium sp.]|nr:4'-phosphopantetheinyl transferase superfamily protein [Clostridium sp.]